MVFRPISATKSSACTLQHAKRGRGLASRCRFGSCNFSMVQSISPANPGRGPRSSFACRSRFEQGLEMQRTTTTLAILLTVPLAGCSLTGKPKKVQAAPPAPTPAAATAPAPPPPLSIPQTNAQLPAPQPVPEGALTTAPPPEEPRPVVIPPPKQPPRAKPQVAAPPKVEATAPPAGEPGRQPVQEVLRPEERTRLMQEAMKARRETRTILTRARRQPKDRVDIIKTFIQQSEDYERSGDVRQSNELAQRALVLARELR